MVKLISFIVSQLSHAAGNQFLSGGLVLGLLGSITFYLKSVPGKLYDLFLRHCTVIVDVNNSAPSFYWLLYWIEKQSYSKKSRRTSIKHVKMKDGESKIILVPSRGNHWFWYKNRLLWLQRNVDKEGIAAPGSVSELVSQLDPKEIISIRVLGRRRDFINDLINEAKELYDKSDEDFLHISRFRWGDWQKFMKPKRRMDSIFLPDGAGHLLNDVKSFINNEEWYRKMGIPYRKGYLFTGPPGTGKSSSAEAIAGELSIPIYVLNLAGLSDSSLESAFLEMDHTGIAIILIEDIDTIQMSRDHTKDTQKISLGTLLNTIDGVQAADNVILIMTSNSPDKLDPALTRKGRVDEIINFPLASVKQIEQAVKRFLPNATMIQLREIEAWTRPLSMAEVQEKLKSMVLSRDSQQQTKLELACLN